MLLLLLASCTCRTTDEAPPPPAPASPRATLPETAVHRDHASVVVRADGQAAWAWEAGPPATIVVAPFDQDDPATVIGQGTHPQLAPAPFGYWMCWTGGPDRPILLASLDRQLALRDPPRTLGKEGADRAYCDLHFDRDAGLVVGWLEIAEGEDNAGDVLVTRRPGTAEAAWTRWPGAVGPLAVDHAPDGTAWIAWTHARPSGGRVVRLTRWRPDAETPDPPIDLPSPPGAPSRPDLALSEEGGIVAWQVRQPEGHHVTVVLPVDGDGAPLGPPTPYAGSDVLGLSSADDGPLVAVARAWHEDGQRRYLVDLWKAGEAQPRIRDHALDTVPNSSVRPIVDVDVLWADDAIQLFAAWQGSAQGERRVFRRHDAIQTDLPEVSAEEPGQEAEEPAESP